MPTCFRATVLWCVCLIGLAGGLSACGQHPGDDPAETRPVLHYFTWSDYVGPEIIQEFERREQVKVVINTFSSNEELLAKLQSGATGYDVAVPSDFMVAIMISKACSTNWTSVNYPMPHSWSRICKPSRLIRSAGIRFRTFGARWESGTILRSSRRRPTVGRSCGTRVSKAASAC